MTRLMGDSVNPWAIPLTVDMAAGYVDCSFAWTPAGWARFVGKRLVRIAAGCDPQDAQVADVENGDYLPWEAVDFALVQRSKGIDPTVYVNLSNWNPTRTEFALRNVPEPHWWLAHYDGIAVLPPGVVAKQYANPGITGGNYDLSIVADFWSGVDNVFGPGRGTIGDTEMLSNTDPVVLDILAYLDRLDTNVKDLYFALGLPQPNPANPADAKSPVLQQVLDAVNALKLQGGALTAAQAGALESIAADLATVKRLIEKDLAP